MQYLLIYKNQSGVLFSQSGTYQELLSCRDYLTQQDWFVSAYIVEIKEKLK